ncbi:hypothetical protein [Brevundimonas basaltis]|uniref:Uncharacterized protein n=1 Tax=Brevundimonas basaltis TaxID=472166 RepID=A0A7W8HZL8_9CAUL|nr:hypothetical protein [Brevundimonas basaltis]MBB5292822.1 hypothetical protein [Brevundimonas basaltis]
MIARLVRSAVPEPDDQRRQALLVMADHWSELLRLRTRAGTVHQPRPQ